MMTGRHADFKLEFVREDDFVEYFLFPELEENLAPETLREQLEVALAKCKAIVERHVNALNYIWHKDEFHLQPRTGSPHEVLLNEEQTSEPEVPLPPHLHGVSHYGENIADEWFIVHLLRAVTRELPGCIARVIDSDGEFQLIEAADVLPKWADPDRCEQRVYIVNGALQLVQNSPSNTARPIPVTVALNKIRLNPTLYSVSRQVEECISARLKEFAPPNGALHHNIVNLPLGVAALLKARPGLVAPAVRAFCEREAADMRACRSMRLFPPEQRVRTNVRFTRCLFAMIMHSDYIPDRKIGWNLDGATNSEHYKEDLLGVKLACGFEILALRAKGGSMGDDGDEKDPSWISYVKSLKAKGYFRNNLEGSKEYQHLLAEARSYFTRNNERFCTTPLVGKEILDLLSVIEINAEQLREEEKFLQPSDSDSWLNISAEQLDAMLMERYGPRKMFKSAGDVNAADFTRTFVDFLDKQSAYDGIENDSDDDDEEEEEGATGHATNAPKNTTRSANIQPDREAFAAKIKKNNSMRRACKQKNSVVFGDKAQSGVGSQPTSSSTGAGALNDDDNNAATHVRNFLDFVIPEDNWDSNSEMSDYENEDDLERNIEAMTNSELNFDMDFQSYMAQMDKELSKTTMGQSFESKGGRKSTASASGAEDDFDDIESFKPIDINVNTLKNMMDSYRAQAGGAGPVTNLLNAMGTGMSAAAAGDEKAHDLTESTV